MRRALEALVFLGLALGIHLGVAGIRSPQQGAASSGDGGEALVSLEASSASLSAMVEDWEKPPELAQPELPRQAPPQIAAPAPAMPDLTPPQAVTPMPGPQMALPQMESLPDLSQAKQPPPPAPAPEPAPKAEPKPQPAADSQLRPKARPAPPAKPVVASQAQRAAGSGGGATAGEARAASAATLNPAKTQSLKSGWGAAIRARVERRKRYPASARGASGSAVLRITVGRDGSLHGVSVGRSSGNRALDQAAVQAVRAARRFPAAPKGLGDASYTFSLPVQFNG
jgi:protein TonB